MTDQCIKCKLNTAYVNNKTIPLQNSQLKVDTYSMINLPVIKFTNA